jgi:hypothetical protein
MGKSAPIPPSPDPFFDRHAFDGHRPPRHRSARRKPPPESRSDAYLKQRERRLWWQLMSIAIALLAAGAGAVFLLRLGQLAAGLGFTTGAGF